MDYGRLTLDEKVLHLHGTPGQARFDFMWEILSAEMAGLVLVVDSTNSDSFPEARELLDSFLKGRRKTPYVVAANKQDVEGAATHTKIHRALDLPRRPYMVAITGYGQEADRQEALAAGFDQHLTKPVGVGTLAQLLRSRGGRPLRD